MSNLVLFLLVGLSVSCSRIHDSIDCLVLGGDSCPASVEYVENLHNQQQNEIRDLDQRLTDVRRYLRDLDVTFDEIDLCNNGKEVLFVINGNIYAYNAGRRGYLDRLTDGFYVTTDGMNCRFKIQNNEVVY